MKNQTHLHFWWPVGEYIFIFGWTIGSKSYCTFIFLSGCTAIIHVYRNMPSLSVFAHSMLHKMSSLRWTEPIHISPCSTSLVKGQDHSKIFSCGVTALNLDYLTASWQLQIIRSMQYKSFFSSRLCRRLLVGLEAKLGFWKMTYNKELQLFVATDIGNNVSDLIILNSCKQVSFWLNLHWENDFQGEDLVLSIGCLMFNLTLNM